MKNVTAEGFNPARCILPSDEHEFKRWSSGDEIDMSIRRVTFSKLGCKTEEGEKAKKIFIEDLKRSGSLNMDTYATIATGKNLITILKEAGEKLGTPVLKQEELHLLEITDERITIPSLAREEIQKLLQ